MRVLQSFSHSLSPFVSPCAHSTTPPPRTKVTPIDFGNYMRFHNRKLFQGAYEPRPFCYAIRRPDHYPEGVLSIEADNNDGTPADPLCVVLVALLLCCSVLLVCSHCA